MHSCAKSRFKDPVRVIFIRKGEKIVRRDSLCARRNDSLAGIRKGEKIVRRQAFSARNIEKIIGSVASKGVKPVAPDVLQLIFLRLAERPGLVFVRTVDLLAASLRIQVSNSGQVVVPFVLETKAPAGHGSLQRVHDVGFGRVGVVQAQRVADLVHGLAEEVHCFIGGRVFGPELLVVEMHASTVLGEKAVGQDAVLSVEGLTVPVGSRLPTDFEIDVLCGTRENEFVIQSL